MATKTKREKAATVLTPAELQEAIRATLAHWFPHCEDASLAFLPGPGMPPLELHVAGDVFRNVRAVGLFDTWYSEARAHYWQPDDDTDAD
ncbi:MAG TPA: hypothetical protein VM533_05680 [Fimbriiglobus sp.]|nr:hypothetical protein [Fimbriiglobus sp.]